MCMYQEHFNLMFQTENIVTARQRSCGKVMFSVVSFCHSAHGGGGLYLALPPSTHTGARHCPLPRTACPPHSPDTFKLIHYEAQTIGKWAFLFGDVFFCIVNFSTR